MADLFALNPELRRGITPFHDDDYKLKVPLGKADLLEKRLANLPKDRKVQVRHHKVKRGETLGLIAQRYRSSVTAIAQVNRIRNVHRLREGQDLLIPLAGGYSAASAARSVNPTSQQLPATHIVRRGDSLSRIAGRYRVPIRDLLLWNNLKVDQIIYPGQRIRILDKSQSVAENSQKTGADR